MRERGAQLAPELLTAEQGEADGLPPDQRLRHLRRVLLRPLPLLVGCGILAIVILAAFGPLLAPQNPDALDLIHEFAPPTPAHPMGTDDLGRDVLSRVIVGTRYSLLAVVIVLSIALVVGIVVGATAGYLGGMVDEVLMRFVDIVFAFPGIVLALALAAALGPSLTNGMLAIAAIWWPVYARLVRGQILSVKNNTYVDAAHALGMPGWDIVRRHLLPNSMAPVLVQLSLDLGNVLVTAAALSFIGLGAQLPTPEWGLMVSTDSQNILTAWWQSTFPGLAIFVTALLFNTAGDIMQEVLLPRARSLL